MMKKIYSVLSVLLTIILMGVFVSCERDKEVMLTAVSITNEQITPMYKSATISSTISSEATIRDVFVQYTVTKDFAEYDEVPMQEKDGIYTAELIDLLDNTTYYYRYAASNRHSAIVLQKIQQFATLQPTVPAIRLDSILTVWDSYAQVQVALEFDGGANVTDMGVCWGTQANPTIEDIHKSTKDTVAVLDIPSLQPNTQYYVRAYAVNKVGVAYSEEKTFTTSSEIALPTVTTATVTQITETTAVAGGKVTSDGGAEITERGVVYATTQNPTTNNIKVKSGTGTGSFTCNLTGLQQNTTYYVRAYAINETGTAYGEEVSFTTKVEVVDNPSSNLRAMPFSVSESKQVYFSKGNLQYHPANNEWRFAENQTDYIGDANSNSSSTYNGWLDLFGWSTSATNFGVNTSTSFSDYSGSFVDWGTNKIGSDAPNTWRTLTYNEWKYLLNTRPNASSLRGVAQVNGVNGLILLPDNWTCPSGITFKSGFHSSNGVDYYAAYQTFTAEQWSKMEAAGAIFLPAAGLRYGSGVDSVQGGGYYWSATQNGSYNAYFLDFYSDVAHMNYNYRLYGLSVRFVKDLQQETVKLLPSVTTAVVTQITETTAVAGGNVTSDGGASVTERGVVYATTQNPTTNNTKVTSGTGTGSFTCNLTGLQPNTTYYVRAYATNEVGTAYGEEVSFTTSEMIVIINPSGSENGHDYVDLGLPSGIMWATMNLGAETPEAYGDYFAWGETVSKNEFTDDNYKFKGLTKYTGFDLHEGTISYGDGRLILEPEDDAAFVNWGGAWRMPTIEELEELCGQCEWIWCTMNGINGYNVKSKINNRSIFLPAAGEKRPSITELNNRGYYRSSSLSEGNPNQVYALLFSSLELSRLISYRTYGESIRPVFGKNKIQVFHPTLKTIAVTEIRDTIALVGGHILNDGGSTIIERGVIYSSENGLIITQVVNGVDNDVYSCYLTQLQPNKTYYVRAYARNSTYTGYGEVVSFTTKELSSTPNNGTENGHEYVDLGLSVKWATCNVGANNPEDYGDYFAWGETTTKDTYNWSTYKYGNYLLTKYNNNSNYGTVDNKTQLDLTDDAAYVNWGGAWRMPTDAELTELGNNCTWTWTSQNGVNGYKVTSKSNGNSIFLPAAGYRYDTSLRYAGSDGYYWSGSLRTGSPHDAWLVNFDAGSVYWKYLNRVDGFTVRPVCP